MIYLMYSREVKTMKTTTKRNKSKQSVRGFGKFVWATLLGLGILVLLLATVFGKGVYEKKSATVSKQPVRVGFSLGVTLEERWLKDLQFFTEKVEELGGTVISADANSDVSLQEKQVDNLLLQGIDVLVIVPEDGKLASVVTKAHQQGVKVIAYDRMIHSPELDYYISFDSVKVGELQAQAVLDESPTGNIAYIGGSSTDNNAFLLKEGSLKLLQPKIASGEVNLVIDTFTSGWKPELAYKSIKSYLASGKTLNGVIAANDGMAGGVVQALSEYGLAGKVPVSGQDADLAAVKRLIAGTQAVTVYKPIKVIAEKSAEVAVAVARGEQVEMNSTSKNDFVAVPSFLIEPTAVTKSSITTTLIDDGFYTSAEVY